MKRILILLFIFLSLVACTTYEDSVPETGQLSGHQPLTNNFAISTNFKEFNKAGDILRVSLTHPNIQTVTGVPKLEIIIDGSSFDANYASGNGTTTLNFEYTITSGQNDLDGLEIGSSINLNGGSITFTNFSGTVNSNTNLQSYDASNFNVDTTSSSILSVSAPINGNYNTSDTIDYTVTFDEPVEVTGTPTLSLNIGGTILSALYLSGSSTTELVFRRTITASDVDTDGIDTQSPLVLSGGTVNDRAGNSSALNFDPSASSSSSVSVFANTSLTNIVSQTLPIPNTYITGETISVTLEFSDIVTVSGSPILEVNLDSGLVNFSYQSGSGSTQLIFTHTVTVSDNDEDGINLVTPLNLNSGSIVDSNALPVEVNYTPISGAGIIINPLPGSVTIDTLTAINILNVGSYTFTGTCSSNGDNISIDVAGLVSDSVTCSSGTFTSSSLDLTSITDSASVSFSVSHNGASDTQTVLKDTVAPSIAITTPSNIDNTNVTVYSLTGTCAEDGLVINVNLDSLTQTTTCSSSTWNVTFDATSVSDGASIAVGANISDLAGNTTTASTTVSKSTSLSSVTIDTLNIINISNVTSYIISGTCSENTMSVDLDIAGIVTTSTTCNSGTYTSSAVDLSAVADSASVTVSVTHNSASDSQDVLKDTVAPTITITTPVDIDATNQSAYSLSGTCDDEGANISVDLVALTQTTTCSSSAWTVVFDASGLSDGTGLIINASITDSASNTGSSSSTVDKDSILAYVTINTLDIINAGNFTAYVISGTCSENGINVDIDIASVVTHSATCTSGTYTSAPLDLTSVLDNASIGITANHDGVTDTQSVLKDTVVPTITLTTPSDINSSNVNSYTLSGACDDATASIDISIGALSSTTSCSGSTWSQTLNTSSITDGVGISVSITISDAATNNSSDSASINKDTSAPIVTLTSPANSSFINISNDSVSFAIAGSCDDATAVYNLLIDGISSETLSCDGTSLSGAFNSVVLSQGAHQFAVEATDASLNSITTSNNNVIKDTISPTVASVTTSATGVQTTGTSVNFTLTFSENVTTTVGLRIPITIGASTNYANCAAITDSLSTTCSYVVLSGEYDDDGIVLSSSLDLNGSTIVDQASNSSSLGFTPPATSSITINNGNPEFEWSESGAVITSYDYGNPNADVTVTFTVKNVGTADSSINFAFTVSNGGGVFSIVTDNCSGIVLPINNTCTVDIKYKDKNPAGLKTGSVTADDSGYPVNPGFTLNLQGTR